MIPKKDIKERTTNILKRMTFKYFKIVDIDNTLQQEIVVTIENTVTKELYHIELSYDFLHTLSDSRLLKYNIIEDYLIHHMLDEDYDNEVRYHGIT